MRLVHARLFVVAAAAITASALAWPTFAQPASTSEQFSDPNVELISFGVNRKGEALVVYETEEGLVRRVLVWGAENALPSNDPSVRQVRFSYDYAGGWGKYRDAQYWRSFHDSCLPYDGPPLPLMVAACKARDGSYWALQSWKRMQPLLGFDPWLPHHTAWELHVSHWTTELPVIDVHTHWTYDARWQGIFGRFTYLGEPVYGFSSTSRGNPKERYSRNVFLDTFNSAYGPGWKRESGILTHAPTGTFCHSFVPQKPFAHYPSKKMRPPADGERYRVTVKGPGVTPVIRWEGPGLAADDRSSAGNVKAVFDEMMASDPICARER